MIDLGEIIVHPNAEDAFQQANQKAGEFLDRFQAGDFGDDIDDDLRQFNEQALKEQADLLGIYRLCSGLPLWIVGNGRVTEVFIP